MTSATTNPKIKNKKIQKGLEKFDHTTKEEDHDDIKEVSKLYSTAIGCNFSASMTEQFKAKEICHRGQEIFGENNNSLGKFKFLVSTE